MRLILNKTPNPICGKYLLAYKSHDFWLEMDSDYVYIVSDNHKDLRVWKFLIPAHDKLPLTDIIDAFLNVDGFRGWLINNGIKDEIHNWMR